MRATKVIECNAAAPDSTALDEAAAVLNDGLMVVAPTETRYGLLVRVDRQDCVERLYRVKKRDLNMPTALFARDISHIRRLAHMTESAQKLAEHFLPGPLTLVLKPTNDWHRPVVTDGRIGLRLSPSPVISGIMQRVGFPLTATSANRSGCPDADTIDEIKAVFGDEVRLYLDAGPQTGETSTVVDCSEEEVCILRPGPITREQIADVLGEEIV